MEAAGTGPWCRTPPLGSRRGAAVGGVSEVEGGGGNGVDEEEGRRKGGEEEKNAQL